MSGTRAFNVLAFIWAWVCFGNAARRNMEADDLSRQAKNTRDGARKNGQATEGDCSRTYESRRLVIPLPASSQYRSSVLAWYMHVYIDFAPCSSAQRPRPESCCHGQAAIGCESCDAAAQSSCRMRIGQYFWHRSDAVNRAGLSQNVASERGKA
jgi:hypothetical protein